MAMSQEEFKSLWERLRELRAMHKAAPKGDVPPGIELLRSLRAKATEESDFIALTTLLESECSWYGLKNEQEAIIREMVARFPEEPMPWISLAGFLLFEKEEPSEAKTVVETALEKALKAGRFVRHAYNTQARIARKLGDYALLEDTLRGLVAYVPQPGCQDVDYEDDFLTSVPAKTVSTEVLDLYRQIVEGRRKAR